MGVGVAENTDDNPILPRLHLPMAEDLFSQRMQTRSTKWPSHLQTPCQEPPLCIPVDPGQATVCSPGPGACLPLELCSVSIYGVNEDLNV